FGGERILACQSGKGISGHIGSIDPQPDRGRVRWHFHPQGHLVISGDSFQLTGDIPESFVQGLETQGMGLAVGPSGDLLWVFQKAGDENSHIGTISAVPGEDKVDIKVCPEGEVLIRPEDIRVAIAKADLGSVHT
ncbi:hypothetical protein KKI23_03115, partial [Patescibacteria group bacterium]|nr:hypothetical protein [Patescibacteria group bacterium]